MVNLFRMHDVCVAYDRDALPWRICRVAMAFHSYVKRIYCVHVAYTPRIPIICHVSRFHSVLELIKQYGLNP